MTRPEPRYRLLRLTESDLLTFIKCRGHRPADYYAIPFLEPDDLPEDAYIAGVWDYRWERNSFLLKVWSSQFDVVEEGACPPEIQTTYTVVRVAGEVAG